MASDSLKKPGLSRSARQRLCILLVGVIAILALLHLVGGPARSPIVNTYSNADLKAKNYLNASEAGPNPFDFCPSFNPLDTIGNKYGAYVLSQTRLHHGSGARIQRVLQRALSGHPITISVIGGSVSACHGSGNDPISPQCYPSKFFQWWNTVFPNPASELTNGAMRRTNSGYFGYCSSHHLPDVTDLVIIELDTDDTTGEEMMGNFEILIRSILLRPDQPAVLVLGHFSPQVHHAHGFLGPDHFHTVVSQFYDVPHISTRAALLQDYMQDPSSINKFYVDPVLANEDGHNLINDVLVAYMQSQICEAWNFASSSASSDSTSGGSEGHGLFGGVGLRKGVPEPNGAVAGKPQADGGDNGGIDADNNRLKPDLSKNNPLLAALTVPAGRVHSPASKPTQEIAPFCVSANDLINPLPPSLFYGSGWSAHHLTQAAGGGSALQSSAHYWFSTLPTSKLRIPIQVGAGDIGIYYLKEPVKVIGEGSWVECWVDDNYGGAKTIENAGDLGGSEEGVPRLEIIDRGVSRGSHFVECALGGDEGVAVSPFKILGVFST